MEPLSPPSATRTTNTAACWWFSRFSLEEGDTSGDFVALDNSQAGIGDTVLVLREGSGARQVLENKDACVISVIVGIVDSVSIRFNYFQSYYSFHIFIAGDNLTIF